jgi:predicted lipase
MLVNSGASADPFLGGQAHGGFAQATENLVKEVVPHIKRAFEEQSKFQKDLKLVITGHSMGAAVGIMAGMKLKQSGEFPNVECWGYCTPACVTLDVARGSKDFATSFIAHHDVVPRFSISAVELLRKRICDFDWDSADKIAAGDDDWSNIRSAADTLQSAQEKQKEMNKSMEQAQEGIGKQVPCLRSM